MEVAGSSPRIILCDPESGARQILFATPGEKLSQAIWLSGRAAPAPLCNGLGLCGNCAVRFIQNPPEPTDEDLQAIAGEELERGMRLSCHQKVPASGDLLIEIPLKKRIWEYSRHSEVPRSSSPCYLGIDIGTTSIEWRAVSESSQTLAEGKFLNPQAGSGADVISRLEAASTPAGLKRLADLAWGAVSEIFADLAASGLQSKRCCIAANSAMTSILMEWDIGGLKQAPYYLAHKGTESFSRIIDGKSEDFLIPPLAGPFLGGDIMAGLFALMADGAPQPFLLADLGTNAELAIVKNSSCNDEPSLYMGSAPMGPAMEGVGPRCGAPAGFGAIIGFKLSPAGLVPQTGNSGEKMRGICAVGYISLLAQLLRLGIVTEDGHLSEEVSLPIGQKIANAIVVEEGKGLQFDDNLFFTPGDMEILLKVKAAFRSAVDKLLELADIKSNELKSVYLAGALGTHVNIEDLTLLGFLPQALREHVTPVGNAALQGATMLAREPGKINALAALAQEANLMDLAGQPDFFEAYLKAMNWRRDGQ